MAVLYNAFIDAVHLVISVEKTRKVQKDQPRNGRRSVILWFMVHQEQPDLGLLSQEKKKNNFLTFPGADVQFPEFLSLKTDVFMARCLRCTCLQESSPYTIIIQSWWRVASQSHWPVLSAIFMTSHCALWICVCPIHSFQHPTKASWHRDSNKSAWKGHTAETVCPRRMLKKNPDIIFVHSPVVHFI